MPVTGDGKSERVVLPVLRERAGGDATGQVAPG
jgi:hypothetical protein